MTHEDAREALTLYALGGLDAPTQDQLVKHLSTCRVCQQALGEEYHTLDALGRGVDQVRPRPDLRARVIGSVARPERTDAGREQRFRAAFKTRWQAVALAAAATLVLITGIGLLNARRELAQVRAQLTTWQLRVAEAEERAVRAADEATSQRRVLAVLTSTDLIEATLNCIRPPTSERARAFLSASNGTLIFTAHGLPALPPNRVYQLWAVVGSTPESAGVFEPDGEGRSKMVAHLPGIDAPPAEFAVTLEVKGGVSKPSGPKYLVGVPSD